MSTALRHGPPIVLSACLGLSLPSQTLAADTASALPCRDRLYVANSYANTLSVIDTSRNAIVATLEMKIPYSPVVAADGARVYVTNGEAGEISVIDPRTNQVTARLSPGPHPTGLDFTPDGKRLLVTLGGETIEHTGNVRVIDLTSGRMSPLIPVGRTPERITAGRDGKHAYVVNRDMSLTVVDIDANKVIASIPLRGNTFNAAVSPKGDKVYLVFRSDHVLGIIDTASNKVEKYVDVAKGPIGLAFSPDGKSLYISNSQDASIQQIDLAVAKVVRTIKVGDRPGLLRLSPDGKKAYIAYSSDKHVGVIDLASGTQLASITTGAPTSLAVCGGP